MKKLGKPNRPKLRTLASTQRALVALEPTLRSLQAKDTTERWHTDPAYRKRSKFYSSRRWQEVRAAVLRHNPCCGWCEIEGRITPATVVDHIVDLSEGGHETDYSNLRALCWGCHSRVTRLKQNGETPPAIPACTPPSFTIA